MRLALSLLLLASFGVPAAAQARADRTTSMCIVDGESGALRTVRVVIRRAQGDTIVAATGRPLRELIAPQRYAAGHEWFAVDSTLVVAGETYLPVGEEVVAIAAIEPFTFFRGVPTFVPRQAARARAASDSTVEGPPAPRVLFLPLGAGCRFQRYRQRRAVTRGPAVVSDTQPFTNVRIFYATNRRRTGKSDPTDAYGNERGPLDLGELTVSVPSRHQRGELERPRWYRGEFRAKEDRHFILRLVTPLGADATHARIAAAVDSAKTHAIFVFVHGFKNSFENAAYRTAQLAYDMSSDEVPVMYSWPSRGSVFAYQADEREAAASVDSLEKFLLDLAAKSGARDIHLIAHSMGTRVLTSALRLIAERNGGRLFSQVVLAAPDIPASAFDTALITRIRSTLKDSARVTMYASSADWALRASEVIHGERRVGQTGPEPLVIDGVDTIDATATSTDFLGHAYYARQGVVSDLVKLLLQRLAPRQRNLRETSLLNRLPYWLLLNDATP